MAIPLFNQVRGIIFLCRNFCHYEYPYHRPERLHDHLCHLWNKMVPKSMWMNEWIYYSELSLNIFMRKLETIILDLFRFQGKYELVTKYKNWLEIWLNCSIRLNKHFQCVMVKKEIILQMFWLLFEQLLRDLMLSWTY